MNRKKLLLICLSLSVVIVMGIRTAGHFSNNDRDKKTLIDLDSTSNENDNLKSSNISRAHAVKMMVLYSYSHDEIVQLPRIINYTDTSEDKWFDKYINAAATLGIDLGEKECHPLDEITYEECSNMLQKFTGDTNGIVEAAVDKVIGNDAVTDCVASDDWLQMLEDTNTAGVSRPIKRESVFLMSIIGEADDNLWEVATSSGKYHFDGFAIDAYTNTTLNILSDGNEIMYIFGTSNDDTVLENAWITNIVEEELTVFYAGVSTTFTRDKGCTGSVALNTIADVTISKGVVVNAVTKGTRISDKILTVSDSCIDTSNSGRLPLSPAYKIYGVYGEITQMDIKSILVGYSSADLVVDNGSICALLVTSKIVPNSIRISLMTNNYSGYFHEKANITSDAGMTVTCGGSQTVFQPGEAFQVDKDSEYKSSGRITITPAQGGKLTVASIKRAGGKPSYRGNIEISFGDEGLIIVNELPIEEYLYAVVPSEMPVSYGAEPLKVQAVCARSYAYMQVMSNALAKYGAHVDDSTSYQVYNNTPETPETIEAVNQTAGQLLTYNGEVVSTYYFSTSCGHTSSGSDVWFGMKNVPYLQGSLQGAATGADAAAAAIDSKYDDLSDNDVFKAFIDDKEFKSYDSSFPWYRWSLQMSEEDVRKSVEKSIASRYKINPSLILTKCEDGNYSSQPVDSVGKIRSIKVDKRSKGGIVTSIILKGSKKTVKILSEYNIRLVLAPVSSRITRNDGSSVDSLSLLPSAFIVINNLDDGGKKTFEIKGGGYGHGVGMSQNGAKTMAEAGLGYQDILKHYYSGCEISS